MACHSPRRPATACRSPPQPATARHGPPRPATGVRHTCCGLPSGVADKNQVGADQKWRQTGCAWRGGEAGREGDAAPTV
eukprot:7383231-Prymnesium_polylepis.1